MLQIVFAIFVLCRSICAENILCTTTYCDEYIDNNSCRKIPDNCRIQNETHSGIFLPYPGPCNCCEYCLENLHEDDACAVGNPSSTIPGIICGDGLSCTAENGQTICRGIDTPCTQEQADFDKRTESGKLGHLEVRAECNRNGLYKPFKCVPGEICYCVSEENDRIFGEIPFTPLAERLLNCECSKNYKSASDLFGRNLHPGEHLRCQSNGNFDTLQCFGDECICVDARDGSPIFADMTPVNVTVLANDTIPCFDNTTHMEGKYYRECEDKYIEILNEIKEYEEVGFDVFGYVFPDCQLDGYYAPVQINSTHIYCVDPDGNILEDFILNGEDRTASDMNCKCARARSIAENEKPVCCMNGNYNKVQCRRGFCRCVDENGNQRGIEFPYANKESLDCFDSRCIEFTTEITTTEPNMNVKSFSLTDVASTIN